VPELARRSPLERALEAGRRGAGPPEAPGVTIAERRGLSLVQALARRGKDQAAAERLGLGPVPGRASPVEAATALWIAPGVWLVVAEGQGDGALYLRLRERLEDLAAVVDQSHGRAVLRLSGRSARDVLAKGCRLDLHPRVFQAGTCAQIAIAQISVLLHQVDDRPTYDLYVAPGYALDFFEWLTASAAEFGGRIEAP
jgi:sarcosine oxidase subunit gamma